MRAEARASAATRAGAQDGQLDLLAVLFVTGGAAALVGMTTTVKLLGAEYSTAQIVWGRYFFHLVIIAALAPRRLGTMLTIPGRGLQLGRGALLFAATCCAYLALRELQLAELSAVMFLAPLLVTGLSAPLLGERIGPRRWAAVIFGLAGALLILRPGTGVFQTAALFAVGCALIYAFYQIVTRHARHHGGPWTSLFYNGLIGALASSLVVPFAWTPPDLSGWLGFALIGLLGGLGHLGLIAALARAPASQVTPFTYTQLIWATLAGFLVFGDIPGPWTAAGAVLIAASGLYVYHRERRDAGDGTADRADEPGLP